MSKRTVSAKGGALAAEGDKTRRAALGALASALIIPKIDARAATADPIFAAIERHNVAWTAVGALSPSIDDVAAMRKGRDVSQSEWDAYERASATEENALSELLATTPATAVGMRAAIAYLVSFDDGYLSESARPFLVTLLKSPVFVGLRSKT
jgi:hypothetical protein